MNLTLNRPPEHPSTNIPRRALPGITIFLLFHFFLSGCDFLSRDAEEVVPPIITEAPPSTAYDTATAFHNAAVPPRDLADLTVRFKDAGPVPETAEPVAYAPGDTTSFWYKNHETNENVSVSAALAHQTENLNFWFQEGEPYDANDLQ